MARGIRNGNVSMTEETARAVKRMIGSMTQKSIAAKLGITRSAVRDIKLGKSWAWL
jgi:DNA-binding transcriptional regulator LsrR (DeoR family)